MSEPTVPGAIAHHFRHSPAQAEQLANTIMEDAIAGDTVAGLACVLAILFTEVEEDDGEEDDDTAEA